MRRFALERWSGVDATNAQPLAQQYDRANGGGLQVSLGPQRSQRSSEASCTIHCTSSSNVARKRLRVLAQVTSRSCRAGCDLKAEEVLFPRCGGRIGNPQRLTPGSQAPHAPPALTFGLPGKQKVNQVQAGRVLIRLLSSLPEIRKFLRMDEWNTPGRLSLDDYRRR
jgi:hypothetical protein